MKAKDTIGLKFGRLTVEKISHIDEKQKTKMACLCDCGNKIKVTLSALTTGHTKSCGCLQRDVTSKRSTTHGMTDTSEYKAWLGIKDRCLSPNNKSYQGYGARGIKVCDRWLNSFENFYKDMGKKPSPRHSLDRINNDGNYEPDNCRWAGPKQQASNKRTTHEITIDGETRTLTAWARYFGIAHNTVVNRINAGWDAEKALKTKPAAQHNGLNDKARKGTGKKYFYNGKSLSLPEWSELTGIKTVTLRHRLKKGWTIDTALNTPTK